MPPGTVDAAGAETATAPDAEADGAGPGDASPAEDGTDGSPPPEDAIEVDAGPPAGALASGTTAFRVTPDGTLELLHDGEVRARIPPEGLELGTLPAIDPNLNYDPYYFEPEAILGSSFFPPDDLTWLQPEAVVPVPGPADSVTLRLTYPGGREGTLTASAPGEGRLRFHWQAGDGAPAVYFRLRVAGDATEGFYGLGEQMDRPEHRGAVRAMHFVAALLESFNNEAHVPIPFLIGTSGWAVFVESMRPGAFAVATEADDVVKTTWGLGPAWEDGLVFHLFTAEHPLDLTRRYYETTGAPALPAPWALGPVIWRDEVDGQVVVEADLETIRSLDLATTGYWIDRPYASGVNAFDFKPSDYSDPAAMIAHAHDLGLRMALWHTPYVDPKDPATTALNAEAKEKGFFPPTLGAVAKWGPPIDFTNAAATAWWQEKLRAYTDLGIEGFKLDYGEETIAGAFGGRLPWLFSDGSDELTMHRRYQLLYHEAYASLLPPDGGFLLVRAGAYGDQVRGVIVWPGDIDATFAQQGDTVTKPSGSTYVSVGGLPAAISAGSSLGPSGFAFFGSDTGGYRNSPPSRETFVRWFQHTALSPVMQVGTSSNDLPWAFGPGKVLDEEMLGWYRAYARLHLRLFPYLWTLASRLATDGRAIQRPLGLAFPELGVHPPFTYLLGDDLLVAPVVVDGATTRTLHMPPGPGVDWWTGDVHASPGEVTVPAPLERIPLFLRAGALLPLLRNDVDTLNPVASGSDVVTTHGDPGPLHIRLTAWQVPAPAEVTLYDGTVLARTSAPSNGGWDVTVTATPGSVYAAGARVEVRLGPGLTVPSATVGGAAATVDVDAAAGLATVALPPGATTATLRIEGQAP